MFGLLFNQLIQILYHTPSASSLSNYAQSFYGLTKGGTGWGQIYYDYPAIRSLSEPQFSRKIFELVLTHIKSQPADLIKGIMVQYKLLFDFPGTKRHIFSFVYYPHPTINLLLLVVLYSLLIIGLIISIKNRKQEQYSFSILTFVGLLISVLLLPNTNFIYLRAYASAIPFIGFPLVIGLMGILSKNPYPYKPSPSVQSFEWIWVLNGVILVLPFLSLIPHQIPVTQVENGACTPGQDVILVRLNSGALINVLPKEESFTDWMPNFHEDVFKDNLGFLPVSEAKVRYGQPEAPFRLATTLDLLQNKDVVVVLNDTKAIPSTNLSTLCGHWDPEPEISGYGKFFFVDS